MDNTEKCIILVLRNKRKKKIAQISDVLFCKIGCNKFRKTHDSIKCQNHLELMQRTKYEPLDALLHHQLCSNPFFVSHNIWKCANTVDKVREICSMCQIPQ